MPSPSVSERPTSGRRARALAQPIRVRLDGRDVEAERGEPVAAAFIAAGRLSWARSPKFHRPRGPTCFRGGCDGCLARVDGVPNVMTCRTAAAPGMCVETQNELGPAGADLLRASDWLFPNGMDPHELFAGVPAVQRALQTMARQISGLGVLPGEARAPAAAHRRAADVLVVGSGPAGMAAALELCARGRSVEVIDDALEWGGAARLLAATGDRSWDALLAAFGTAAGSRLVFRPATTAAGLYGDDVLVACDDDVEIVTPRVIVLSPGAHDGVLAFEGNDVPGVMSARAACALESYGVRPGKHPVVVVPPGAEEGGRFGAGYARSVPGAVLVVGMPLRARGGRAVREVTVSTATGEQRLECDLLAIDAPRAPAHELCAQAGAELSAAPVGFLPRTTEGRIRAGVFVTGEAAGTALDVHAILREARRVSDGVAA